MCHKTKPNETNTTVTILFSNICFIKFSHVHNIQSTSLDLVVHLDVYFLKSLYCF